MFPYNFKKHQNHVYDKQKIKLLKTSAIYGANASGKSNFIKAMDFFKSAILGEESVFIYLNNHKFKLNPKKLNEDIQFEIELFLNNKFYYYELSLNNEGISKEALYYRLSQMAKDRMIFKRFTKNGKHKLILGNNALKTKSQRERDLITKTYAESILDNNLTFLRAFYHKGSKDIDAVMRWFAKSLLVENRQNSLFSFILAFVFNDKFKNLVNKIIKQIDAGIDSIDYETYHFDEFFGRNYRERTRILYELKNKRDVFIDIDTIASMRKGKPYVYKIFTFHKDQNDKKIKFEFSEESDGTLRFISLLPMISDLKNNEMTFFIDEIGRSLHPTLLKEIIKFVLELPTKGQFIFTTHESHILDLKLFRQDEIWFVEKNIQGSSNMYSLAEFKPRADKDIRRGYLEGLYGAIPFLTGFEHTELFHDENK